jgi:hypothetical protein
MSQIETFLRLTITLEAIFAGLIYRCLLALLDQEPFLFILGYDRVHSPGPLIYGCGKLPSLESECV